MKGWLDNYNDSKVKIPTGFVGYGETIPNWKSPAWGGQFGKGGTVSMEKAKEILRDGTAHGHKLTAKQKRYFGWIAGGKKEEGGWLEKFQNGGEMSYYQNGLDFKPKTISQDGAIIERINEIGENSPISEYDDLITASAKKHGIPATVFHRLIYEESKHKPNAKSGKGAYGLGQITKSTAKAYGLDPNKLSDPAYNIDASARILKAGYDDRRVGNWKDAVGYYNFGNQWFTEEGKKRAMKMSPNYYKNIFYEIDMLDNPDPSYIQPIPVSVADKTFVAPLKRDGGIVRDNLGYWNPDNWGKAVEINSPNITMEGVDRELVGISDMGDTKLLKPGKNYKFKGTKVREYPVAKYGINELHELTDFTNKPGKERWLNKYS